MPRAILKDGVIYPIEPLPPDWMDGRELLVEDGEQPSPAAIDRWYADMEELTKDMDPEDDKRLEEALAEADRLAKAQVRREMGLT
jgi:hypothetical protein